MNCPLWRKRRGLDARKRYGSDYIVIAEAPELVQVGRSDRTALAQRRTKINSVTRGRILELSAAGWSLRRIATDVGVSHESVRAIQRDVVTESR